mmetsp:Transcript_25873/g.74160  ORF Transcript_25873/g.74160 Transcript_25873/m.74160 type:complete len:298 (-) Transcript_25873:433-1326(-)
MACCVPRLLPEAYGVQLIPSAGHEMLTSRRDQDLEPPRRACELRQSAVALLAPTHAGCSRLGCCIERRLSLLSTPTQGASSMCSTKCKSRHAPQPLGRPPAMCGHYGLLLCISLGLERAAPSHMAEDGVGGLPAWPLDAAARQAALLALLAGPVRRHLLPQPNLSLACCACSRLPWCRHSPSAHQAPCLSPPRLARESSGHPRLLAVASPAGSHSAAARPARQRRWHLGHLWTSLRRRAAGAWQRLRPLSWPAWPPPRRPSPFRWEAHWHRALTVEPQRALHQRWLTTFQPWLSFHH